MHRENLLALAKKVKDILIAQVKEPDRSVTEWEQTFITTHGTHPNPEDTPEMTAKAMRKRKRFQ